MTNPHTKLFFSLFFLCLLLIFAACKKQQVKTPEIIGNIIKPVDTLTEVGVPADAHYNIVLVLYDDIGYEIPSYTGGQSYSTPNIDMLAAQGMQFTKCHATPVCSPSRYMLLSGQYNFRNYVQWGIMKPDEYSIANLMKTAGYKTCIAGKWQLDGGGDNIKQLGFDNFLVNQAFYNGDEGVREGPEYKNPLIYGENGYWPGSATNGKYSQDIFQNFVFNFIDNSKAEPFFIYWALNLAHKPFSPTPNNPDYAKWDNPDEKPGDIKYFPGMVNYMDSLTGQLIQKLREENLLENTIILVMADNGTPEEITSTWNGQKVIGGKSSITEAGTHVPMIAYCPGTIAPGIKDTGLISMVDIMPTLASLTHTPIPATAGTMDGVSFAPRLFGVQANYRNWIYCNYQPHPEFDKRHNLSKWMQNSKYKRIENEYGSYFINIEKDPFADIFLYNNEITEEEKLLNASFTATMAAIK